MKSNYLLIFFILLSVQTLAQKHFKRNTIYTELGGTGVVISLNYERMLSNKPGFAYHVGAGLGGNYPAIPFGVKYLFSLGNEKSFIETGAGITIAERYLLDDKYNFQTENEKFSAGFIPSVGYRHHTPYGLMWRLNYTPLISTYRILPLYFGISIGWRF